MKQFRLFLISLSGVILITLFVISCQKDVSGDRGIIPSGQSKLSVYLTDGPNDFQEVLIDIQAIYVKVDTCEKNGRHDNDRDDHDDRADEHDSAFTQAGGLGWGVVRHGEWREIRTPLTGGGQK